MDRNANDAHIVTVCDVALRKESVDRNVYCNVYKLFGMRRSPQGERG